MSESKKTAAAKNAANKQNKSAPASSASFDSASLNITKEQFKEKVLHHF